MSLTPEARDRLERLKERISVCHVYEDKTVGFNMYAFTPLGGRPDWTGHNCPTVCCIGGHARYQAKEEEWEGILPNVYSGLRAWAQRLSLYLGITEPLAMALFQPNALEIGSPIDLDSIILAQAQEAIQSILDSGGKSVTWKFGERVLSHRHDRPVW